MPPLLLLLFIAACAGIVIAPFLFESYTFYLYTIREPEFFIFSGARLWVFLTSELSLGFAIGRTSRLPLFATAGCIAAAIVVLMLLLYQFCDARQCYYSGPDGTSWLRLGTLLFSTATTGLLTGGKSRREPQKKKSNSIDAMLFGATTVIFLGYYPVVLLFGMFLAYPMALALLAFASSAPFFFAGIASSAFSDRARHAMYSAIIGWAVLAALFASLRLEGTLLLAIMVAAGIPAALLGRRIANSKQKELTIASSFSSMITLFALVAVHPLLDAPMNLAINDSSRGAIVQPTYYSGAHHDEPYFPTKRVEVGIDLGNFDDSMMGKSDFILAGIGAQSPNCCKDGIDYGYRADILFEDGARYLVARAWETCDQNIACSAFPWISTMHESIVSLTGNSSLVMLAMEWNDMTVDWYYKTSGNWSKYSSFVPPEIENPYFNLGVIWVGNPNTNPVLQNAYFYQAGVSTPSKEVQYGQITFECPSYYDKQGTKHCPPLTAIKGGSSDWKVLWKWGLPNNNAKVAVQRTNVTVGLG
jgi:hypothetical protein